MKIHNIVGLVPNDGFLGRLSAGSDGIVAFESGHLDDVESEIIVPADHVTVHQHPRSVMEVRRILLSHLEEIRTQFSNNDPTHDHIRDHAAYVQSPRLLTTDTTPGVPAPSRAN